MDVSDEERNILKEGVKAEIFAISKDENSRHLAPRSLYVDLLVSAAC